MLTVYGELCRYQVKTDDETYQLTRYSNVRTPRKGWCTLCKSKDKWLLVRFLDETKANVLPNWNTELKD